MLLPQKTGSHKTVGHLFKTQIWIFENFSSFLVLSGTGNKRSKIPSQKQVHRLCSAGHTSLESFPFQTATQIFLTSMETLLSFHVCKLMPFRKNGLSADGTEPLHWHSDFFSIFTFQWDCSVRSLWSSYLQRFRITSGQTADPLSPN